MSKFCVVCGKLNCGEFYWSRCACMQARARYFGTLVVIINSKIKKKEAVSTQIYTHVGVILQAHQWCTASAKYNNSCSIKWRPTINCKNFVNENAIHEIYSPL